MLPQTWTFAAFFLVVYPVHLLVRNTRLGKYWLLIASLAFYAWWRPEGEEWSPFHLYVLLYCTAVDYVAGLLMGRGRWKRALLTVTVINHVGVLLYFKYAVFFTESLNAVLGGPGVAAVPVPDVTLPLGVSFYTFLAISYIVDVYRGDVDAERHPVRFAALVTFFPKLLAGPIERATTFLPRLRGKVHISVRQVTDGLSLFLVGFFKKRGLADFLAIYVGKVYADPAGHNALDLVLATFLFTWQIYFDFSGYTDMARGVAKMMGYDLMPNFNRPYLSASLTEFWRRWHISLSTWFRDYVYIPLGGSRRSRPRVWGNLFVTLVISGLWHGAGWTWVLWGALHGAGLCGNKTLDGTEGWRRLPKPVRQAAVFLFVMLTWVFFRGGTWATASTVLSRMFTTPLTAPLCPLAAVGLCVAVWAYEAGSESRWRSVLTCRPVRIALGLGMLVYLVFGASGGVQPFIYGGKI